MTYTDNAIAITEDSSVKHYLPEHTPSDQELLTLCGQPYGYVVSYGAFIAARSHMCSACEDALSTQSPMKIADSDTVGLGGQQPTLGGIEQLADRSSKESTHREVTIYAGSYRNLPLPTADPRDRTSLMSMGGNVRYLFHDHDGLIEVEYINGLGVERQTFLNGERIARVYTSREAYAPVMPWERKTATTMAIDLDPQGNAGALNPAPRTLVSAREVEAGMVLNLTECCADLLDFAQDGITAQESGRFTVADARIYDGHYGETVTLDNTGDVSIGGIPAHRMLDIYQGATVQA